MLHLSTYFSKPIVALRVINSSKVLQSWIDNWRLAIKELNKFSNETCINCENYCLAYKVLSVSFTPSFKSSSTFRLHLTLIPFLCMRTISLIPILQHGLTSTDFLFFVSISCNLIEEPVFLRNFNWRELIVELLLKFSIGYRHRKNLILKLFFFGVVGSCTEQTKWIFLQSQSTLLSQRISIGI